MKKRRSVARPLLPARWPSLLGFVHWSGAFSLARFFVLWGVFCLSFVAATTHIQFSHQAEQGRSRFELLEPKVEKKNSARRGERIEMLQLVEDRPLLLYCGIPLIALWIVGQFLPQAEDLLGLVTANTLITHTYVWNLVSSAFFEASWMKVVLDIGLLGWLSSMVVVESLEQFLLYFIFSLLACSLGSSAYCLGRFVFSGHDDALTIPLYGFNGVLMCLMMFVRRHKSSAVVFPQFPALTFQNLPIFFLLWQLLLYTLATPSLTRDLLFSAIALLFCWSYLRFFYKFEDNDQTGTRGDEFSFVAMFPEVSHIVLIPFTTAFYNIMALLGVFPALEVSDRRPVHHLRAPIQPSKEDTLSPTAASAAPVDLVGERRRAKAMKMLDAKMAELAREPEGWDDVGSQSAQGDDSHFELSKLKV